MVNVPTPEFQKLWSNLIGSLRLEYENTIPQHPDADAVTERVCGALIVIPRLAGCTPASVGASSKWTLFAQNMAVTRRDLHQFLQRKAVVQRLYEVYTEMLHDLRAVLKENAAKGERAKSAIT
jgi:hypothetical protein